MAKRKTAGELAKKALEDTTKYDAREVAHAVTEDIEKSIFEAVSNYRDKIDQDEFCVVMVIASDPLIKNMIRRKFYCWPYLPKPRPNQTVFLYNKKLDQLTKRLWVLPNAQVMAELATSDLIVRKDYKTMQAWSVAFYKGTFWDFIRYEHDIKMLSQDEFDKLNSAEINKATLNDPDAFTPQPFDFSKVGVSQVTDTEKLVSN